MSRYRNGRDRRTDHDPITPDHVFDAICRLAVAHATLPTQAMIADELGCSQQHVSSMMQLLALPPAPRIFWLTQRVYYVDKSRWRRLDDSEVSPSG